MRNILASVLAHGRVEISRVARITGSSRTVARFMVHSADADRLDDHEDIREARRLPDVPLARVASRGRFVSSWSVDRWDPAAVHLGACQEVGVGRAPVSPGPQPTGSTLEDLQDAAMVAEPMLADFAVRMAFGLI